ncbi:MAG: hypothetical protein IJK51_04385 [Bacteroidaceae bacterium]|nr:hypothetical protein [Bacteroidaceae bacterium]
MKKKLFQIIMLLVATVSVGSFVSCKDTNEDLYNELRVQTLDDNAKLADALNARIKDLQDQIDLMKKWEDQLCKCDPAALLKSANDYTNAEIAKLKAIVDALGDKADAATVADLTTLVNNINARLGILEGQNLDNRVATLEAAQGLLKEQVDKLEKALEEVRTGTDGIQSILQRLATAEEAIKNGKTAAEQLAGLINDAQGTADDALALAQKAFDNAQEALKFADRIAALEAGLDAEKGAKELAKEALQRANDAYDLATIIQGTANTNKENIATLQGDLKKLGELVEQYKGTLDGDISDLKERVARLEEQAKNIEKNANAIKDIENRLDGIDVSITAASDKANDAYDKAVEAFNKADANEKTISELSNIVTENKTNIGNLQKDVEDLQEAVKQISVNTTNIKNLQDALNTTNGNVSKLSEKYDDLESEVSDLRTELATIKGDCANNLLQAKLYVQEEIEALKTWITTELKDYVKKSDLDAYATDAELNKAVSDLIEKINAGDQTLGQALSDLTDRVGNNETAIWYINEALKYLAAKSEDFVSEDDLKTWAELLKASTGEQVANAKADILKELLDKLAATVDAAKTEINNNINNNINIAIGSLETGVTEARLKELIESMFGTSDPADLKDLAGLIARVTALEAADKTLAAKIQANKTTLGEVKYKVEKLTERVEKLEYDVRGLTKRMERVESKLTEINTKVEKLTKDVAAIQSYLAKQITGITIQGTNNPMFGSFSIPANIQSNMLVAYYGTPANVEFPTTDDAKYIRKAEVLTAKDWEMITMTPFEQFKYSGTRTLVNEDENGKAYAGKVYVTVNPTTVDATGLNLEIVNSQDEPSLITLSPLKKSYETLKFGLEPTRADNGFYEASAFVSKKQIENVDGIEFKEEDLTNLIEDARSEIRDMVETFFKSTGATGHLDKVATDMYQVLRSLSLERKGLKCPFKDINDKDQAIYSQYNLAATAVKPLTLGSLKFLEDYDTFPGFEDAQDYILKDFGDALKEYVHVYFKKFDECWTVSTLKGFNFDGITLVADANNLILKWEARLSSFTMNGNGYRFDIPASGSVDIMFDEGLTNSGAAVTIPDAYKFIQEKFNVKRTTLVIKGDLTDGLTAMLVVPARSDSDGQIAAYATADLTDTFVNYAGGVITLTKNTGATLDIASVAANVLSTLATETALGNLEGTKGSVTIPVVTEVSKDLRDLIKGQDDVIKTLTALVENLNHFLGQVMTYEPLINSNIDDFLNSNLIKYLKKIDHTTMWFFQSINRRFGPFIVASNDNKGFKRMSLSPTIPTEMEKSGLKLYPTTKNMELIVPIARKHVAVTNVFVDGDLTKNAQDGDIACIKKLSAANQDDELNVVLDGTTRCVHVNNMDPGYIYEVAYSVLDFEGNISTYKTYIKVK